MKHTSGKWRSFTDNANGFGVTNGNTVIAIAGETDLKENEANANLIAAAPELLRTIKPLIARIKAMDPWAKNYDQVKDAEKAIAKTEGK